jgi:hypothetical protein
MKTSSFRLIAVAASAAVTGAAFAVVGISTTGSSNGALTYANELTFSATASMAPITASSILGFGISSGQVRFIRVDVANATFAAAASTTMAPTAATPASVTSAPGSAGAAVPVGFGASLLVSGGASGASSAIFQVQASWNGGQSPNDAVSIALPPLVPTSTGSDVTATYQLFETAGAAVNNTAGTALASATGSIAKFGSGLLTTISALSAGTTVSTAYKNWASPSASVASAAVLGTISITPKASVMGRAGSQAIIEDFLAGTGNSLVVSGDFSVAAASGVFLASDATCGIVAGLATLNAASTVATIPFAASTASAPFAATGTTANPAYLCYKTNGTAIAAGSYSAQPSIAFAASTTKVQPTAASIGVVSRDGTTLQAPFIQTTHKVRFVLTNTSSTPASYTAVTTAGPTNSTTDPTNTVTGQIAGGTIPANGQVIIEGSALPVFSNANSPRGFVVFTVAAPTTAIKGVYQLVHSTTGAISNMSMLLP